MVPELKPGELAGEPALEFWLPGAAVPTDDESVVSDGTLLLAGVFSEPCAEISAKELQAVRNGMATSTASIK